MIIYRVALIVSKSSADLRLYENLYPTNQVIVVLTSPTIPAGEDEASLERHNNQIRAEISKKGKKNQIVLTALIKQTFPICHKDITKSPCHSSEILMKYPFLKEVDQVCIVSI